MLPATLHRYGVRYVRAAEHKYLTDHAALCLYCQQWLTPQTVTWNPRHLFHCGQLFECRCGKSRIWGNSVREPAALVQHWETGAPYHAGFCNDLFCGFTYAWVQPLQNAMPVPPGFEHIERWSIIDPTRYGNPKHPTNHHIAVWKSQMDPDGGEAPIAAWYTAHRAQLERVLHEHAK